MTGPGPCGDAVQRGDLSYGCGNCRHRLEHGTGYADVEYYRWMPEPADPAWPEVMAFGLSNTCNLACVMCGGNLSSRLRALEGRPRLEPAYGDRFFAELEEFLPHVRRTEFRGGEPFLIREHHRVWDLLADLGLSPRGAGDHQRDAVGRAGPPGAGPVPDPDHLLARRSRRRRQHRHPGRQRSRRRPRQRRALRRLHPGRRHPVRPQLLPPAPQLAGAGRTWCASPTIWGARPTPRSSWSGTTACTASPPSSWPRW